MIASAGITLGEKTGWFSALRYRYFGPRPLTEDNAFVSPATGLLNGRLGYRFDNGWRVQLDAFNLLNSHSDQITYAYGSLLKSDSLFAMCFPGSRNADRAGCCLPDRRDGPRAASGRAAGDTPDRRGAVLTQSRGGDLNVNWRPGRRFTCKAPERLAGLRTAEGTGLPANIIEEFRRDMARLELVLEQISSKTRAERLERAPDTDPS